MLRRRWVNMLSRAAPRFSCAAISSEALGSQLAHQNGSSFVLKAAKDSSTDVHFFSALPSGTIGICLSPYVKRVVGLEFVREAIEDANYNAELNGNSRASIFEKKKKDPQWQMFLFLQVHLHPETWNESLNLTDSLIWCEDSELSTKTLCRAHVQLLAM